MVMSRFHNHHFGGADPEDPENSPEYSGGDSPRSRLSSDTKIASTSSSRRSRRAIQKRVVSVPIKDVEGIRMKGDHMTAPPSDSWAWRKYGQKPIKGSPYPRGYYRCSSSKGCPARKQVERSRTDPTMLVVTYSCEHNHPWPASRNHHHTTASAAAAAAVSDEEEEEEEEEEEQEEQKKPTVNQSDHDVVPAAFPNLGHQGPPIHSAEFGWFADLEFSNYTLLESPILAEERIARDDEMAMIFTAMGEEDESLFADLGELPECSAVFRREMAAQREAEQQRSSLATTT